jgi:putative SOS response-associated peptidase YedK
VAALEWVKAGAFNPSLLKPFASELMEHYPVSTRINDPKQDDAECIRRSNDSAELLPGFNFSG